MHISKILFFALFISILSIEASQQKAYYLYIQNDSAGASAYDIKVYIHVIEKNGSEEKPKRLSKVVKAGEREWLELAQHELSWYRKMVYHHYYCIERIDLQIYPHREGDQKHSFVLKNPERDACNDLGILIYVIDEIPSVGKAIRDANIENRANPFEDSNAQKIQIVPLLEAINY